MAVELGEMVSDLITQQLRSALLVIEGCVQVFSYGCGELLGEPDGSIVAHDGIFDVVDLGVASEAGPILLAAAEEVEVFAPVPDGTLKEKAALVAVIVALAAPHTALEVVSVLAESFAGRGSGLEDRLDAFEEFFADQWLVSALVELAVVGDDTHVVGVTQHRLEFRRRYRPAGVAAGS